MNRLRLATAAVAAMLAVSPAALAQQQNQGGGWSGTLDQLNRAVNPNSYEGQQQREQIERDRRNSGASGYDDSARSSGSSGNRGGSRFDRYSDRELQDQYDRVADEQRRVQRERRDLEDEMSRRGLSR
ncbi:hypothetical protein [Azospirillum sp. SYSU D00513]|uniref:hypothetical protein n=1 Tax=Azospirillum sp. SYSU D00513 TaxID=2812561 RepID=UPI001A973BB7|nr:hypothetical protein [Azospirillum sp. SYSU D00513]